jgi:4-amino-4-deoxy-L-arabinose transferase-like glycosyltransferase
LELRDLGNPGLAFAVKQLAAAIAAVTAIRLVVAAVAPLAPDETYYWVWSHALAPGYLDHPPMVALWIRAGTLLAGQTAFGIRLLGPVAAALASWMLFDTARSLFPGTKAGVAAVLLLNATLLLGVGTVIMTPDSPLLFFWIATLWAMARIAAGGPGIWWLAGGLFAGLALDSKYTALLLWIGVGLWVVLVPGVRPWLRRWQPWAACAIGLGLFAPVLAWNAAHDWAGFARQGGRIGDWQPTRALGFLAELVGGQIGLVTPVVWVLFMMGLVAAMRNVWRSRDPGWSLLAALSVPPVLVFVQHALGDRVQGNWPAIVYPALAVAAGGPAIGERWWTGAAALGFAITSLAYVQATTGVLPLPPGLDPIAMRLAGWDGLAQQLRATGTMGGASFVTAEGYGLASELAWWMPRDIPIVGTDERWRLTALPTMAIAGRSGLLVRNAGRGSPPDAAMWTEIRRIGTMTRTGAPGPNEAIYQVTAADASPAAVALPHR